MSQPVRHDKLRRIALASQGLLQPEPFGRGVNATLRAIKHLGYVQIDTISVVVRAHNHVLQSRVPNYQPKHLQKLLKERKIFETRFPVAAFRPIEDFRFTLLHAHKWRARKLSADDKATMKRVLERIRSDGPLRSRDFEDARDKSAGWWDWKPAKRALEQLFFQGDLMISARDGFQKTYDLTERVLPAGVDTTVPTMAEFANYLVGTTTRAHGLAAYKSFASGARFGTPIGKSLRAELKRRCESGELTQINTKNTPMWADPRVLDSASPRHNQRAKLLSPFDNAITNRERLADIFAFDYQIECFVPEAKRRYGYYCLPILFADRLVGRMDCKSHRDQARFEIKALYVEPEYAGPKVAEELMTPLANAVWDYARFDACSEVSVTRSEPAFVKPLLQQQLASCA